MRSGTTLFAVFFVVLLAAVVILALRVSRPWRAEEISEQISFNVQRAIEQSASDIALIQDNLPNPQDLIGRTEFPFFIYSNDSVSFWSSNSFVPPGSAISNNFQLKMLKSGGGVYLLHKVNPMVGKSIVSLIPLQRDYLISNEYLNREFNRKIFSSTRIEVVEPESVSGISVFVDEQCIFKVIPGAGYPAANNVTGFAGLLLTGLLLAVTFVLLLRVSAIIAPWSSDLSYLFLVAVAWSIREAMVYFNIPGIFSSSDLFSPRIFAASALNASLGDLLLNMVFILLLCIFLFRAYFRSKILVGRKGPHPIVTNTACVLAILYAGLFPFVVIQTIYNNSAISLDISQDLHFDFLRIVSYIVILVAGVCAFLFSHVFVRILAHDRNRIRVTLSTVIALALFVFFNYLTGQMFVVSAVLTLGYVGVVMFFHLYKSLKRLTYSTFSYFFLAIFFLAVNGAFAIRHFSHREKIQNQFRFATSFLADRDVFGEYLLREVQSKIANDAFTQTRLITPFLRREAIDQKIRQYFLPSYFNKYDVQIFIYDAVGQPIGNEDIPTFAELVSDYDQQAEPTDFEGIRFLPSPGAEVTQKYIVVVPVRRIESISGYVVMELSLKKIIPENVYPELLVDHSRQELFHEQDMSYAVLANGTVQFSSGDFNYQKSFERNALENPKLYTEGLTMDNYDHIAHEDDNGRVAVVSSKSVGLVNEAANFSFLFVLGLLLILILFFIQGMINYLQGRRLFFSARIQLYLNLAFFIPLIIVSVSTLGLTSRSSQQQLGDEYLSKSRSLAQQLTNELDGDLLASGVYVAAFNNRLSELSDVSKLEANVYNAGGILAGTTQPLIFENHLLSTFANPSALQKIRSGENFFIEAENVGKLSYFVAYTSLRSAKSGSLIGVLGVPFFQSQHSLEKIQVAVLGNILNIFALIFIALLVVSYFVSRWLTFPLTFITQSLKRTSLTNTNKPLSWNSSDEIGMMVREYNSMLYKLSESKSELEITQREKAWREIAQQVAHEIKNPLTPMKLTLQQLERSVESGNGSVEKISKAITSLLGQVNTLDEIASSFSGFAKMPELKIVKVDLVPIIQRCVELHSSSGEVTFKTRLKNAFVNGDEQLLERTVSNLIINGFQSTSAGEVPKVIITLDGVDKKYSIEIKDNGRGIPTDIQDLVFLPHFSTKKSGSGLGLAIAKQGIEQMNGKIYFKTEIGKGTSFFIDLPAL